MFLQNEAAKKKGTKTKEGKNYSIFSLLLEELFKIRFSRFSVETADVVGRFFLLCYTEQPKCVKEQRNNDDLAERQFLFLDIFPERNELSRQTPFLLHAISIHFEIFSVARSTFLFIFS